MVANRINLTKDEAKTAHVIEPPLRNVARVVIGVDEWKLHDNASGPSDGALAAVQNFALEALRVDLNEIGAAGRPHQFIESLNLNGFGRGERRVRVDR